MTKSLNRRQIKIVSELNNSDGYLTSNYLAKVLGVSSRTVRNDLKELNELFFSLGLTIDSLTSKGYIIKKAYRSKIDSLLDLNQTYHTPILPQARIEYIKHQLFIHPKGVSLGTISKKLFVSDSTIARDFILVRKWFKDKSISLKKKNHDTYFLYGEEMSIRDLYVEVFKSVDVFKYSKNLDSMNRFEKKIKKISDRLAKTLYVEDIKLPGYDFNYLVMMTSITIYRNECDFSIGEFIPSYSQFSSQSENILLQITKGKQIDLNDLSFLIHTYNTVFESNQSFDKTNTLTLAIEHALNEVSDIYNYTYSSNVTDKILKSLMTSSSIDKAVLDEVKIEYPLASEMAMKLCDLVKTKSSIQYNDSMLIRMVYILAYDLEHGTLQTESKPRKTVIITDLGEHVFELIKVKIKRHFPNIHVLGYYPTYMYLKALSKEPDFLISTKPLDTVKLPFVIINPICKDYDVLKITTLIKSLDYPHKRSFDFQNLFRENLFARDIQVNTQYDAIKYLYHSMESLELAEPEFLDDVLHREALSSTYINHMVAMPHAISKSYGDNVVSVLITDKPIDWNGELVQVIFLINMKNVSENNIKQIFKTFFDLINSSSAVQRIIKSKNFYEFIKSINLN